MHSVPDYERPALVQFTGEKRNKYAARWYYRGLFDACIEAKITKSNFHHAVKEILQDIALAEKPGKGTLHVWFSDRAASGATNAAAASLAERWGEDFKRSRPRSEDEADHFCVAGNRQQHGDLLQGFEEAPPPALPERLPQLARQLPRALRLDGQHQLAAGRSVQLPRAERRPLGELLLADAVDLFEKGVFEGALDRRQRVDVAVEEALQLRSLEARLGKL